MATGKPIKINEPPSVNLTRCLGGSLIFEGKGKGETRNGKKVHGHGKME